MHNSPHILSIIEEYLGHKTYGKLMRAYFNQVDSCQVDFYWYNEERELRTRIINRLLSYYPANKWVQNQNIDFHVLRFQLGFAYMAKRLAIRKLKQASYSALHFHTQPLAYLALDLMRSIPTIVSIDRTIAQAAIENTDPQWQWTYAPNIWLDRQVFQHAAGIVCFSEASRRSVINEFQIDDRKAHVIYPGVNLQQITMPDRTTHPQQPCKILFIGGDFERKGGFDLLAVFLSQFADVAELHLVTQAEVTCDHPNVHIYRQIEAYTSEWLALYHQADMFVMPTYSEPFGWVFIEAMAAGLPIVATDLNAIPEMVTPGETGLLVQPGNRFALARSLRILIEHPDLRRSMGMKARQVAKQKFDANKNFQALERLFQDVAITQPYRSAIAAQTAV
ncbi:glycosyltransferase family 4 protein [Pantanalinema sp. GBBB05]|uniref:glycosyltransferase family 4 protein n=1 Tax=Pantanalinema sp. GBBB05 TaxID=2604139 RepID=UPI001DFCF8CC|nr:glycosyltransferase family 4 protein [Pantanalinema sp. GBBB05]